MIIYNKMMVYPIMLLSYKFYAWHCIKTHANTQQKLSRIIVYFKASKIIFKAS